MADKPPLPPLEAPLLIHGEQKARQYLGLTKEQFEEAQNLGFIECIDIVRRAPRFVKQHLLAQGQEYLDDLAKRKGKPLPHKTHAEVVRDAQA